MFTIMQFLKRDFFPSSHLVVRNSIDTISILYLGIDTWYCHWNSNQKCPKKLKAKVEITRKHGKCWRNLKYWKSKSGNMSKYVTNLWMWSLWWEFPEVYLSIATSFAKVSIPYRYLFSSIFPITIVCECYFLLF